MAKYVLAIDQGTTSSRAILFDKKGQPKHVEQMEFPQHYPQPGWVEHDPKEILDSVLTCCEKVLKKAGAGKTDIAGIGVTNQRETTIAWDKNTGSPLHKAIVWLDVRTAETAEKMSKGKGGKDRFREKCGLPISTYFSALKMKWLIDNVPDVKKACEEDRCCFGTVDSWLIYSLTGGKDGGVFVTDVSNASRYLLMNIKSLSWDEGVCKAFGIPTASLPEIRSNSEVYGLVKGGGSLDGIPISGALGDQHAALLGQGCLSVGTSKNTYGTGCFMLMNTGKEAVPSTHGLLTTMGFKLGPDAPVTYALEGSIACAGRAVQWLRDNFGIIKSAPEIETLAASVEDTGGVTLVPAFSGLFAPYWREDARAVFVGMTLHTRKEHLCRATLEAVAFQSIDVINAMKKDMGVKLGSMRVDGGMTQNSLLMQIQSDLLGVDVLRPKMPEATALGAAFAAGLAVKFFEKTEEVQEMLEHAGGHDTFKPTSTQGDRSREYARWKAAVERSLDLERWGKKKPKGDPADKPLRKPRFNKASKVKPEQTGLNLLLKVLKKGEESTGFCELACADDTGCITLRLKQDLASVFTAGDILRVQNARASMVKNYLRITVDKWGKVSKLEDEKDLEVKTDKDFSAIEYELA